MSGDVADKVARVEAMLDELRQKVDNLEAENGALRRRHDQPEPVPAVNAPVATPDPADAVPTAAGGGSHLGRRRVLTGGATAAVAGLAAAVASSTPAAAANGDPILAGQGDAATASTSLGSNQTGESVFTVNASGTGTKALGGFSDSSYGVFAVSNSSTAVWGQSPVRGLFGITPTVRVSAVRATRGTASEGRVSPPAWA